MATSNSPIPIYHDPSFSRNHSRRSSTRKSFTSWTTPHLESPRIHSPRDEDAFVFGSTHLPEWYAPEKLWNRFPQSLQKALVSVQHGGAAVLTSFERLDKHLENAEGHRITHRMDEDELLVNLDVLPSPEMRLVRQVSSAGLSVSTDSASIGSPALSSSQSTSTTPISPICLTPVDIFEKPERHRERSFNAPLEAHDAHYRNELSYLRTEALPRLRHACLKVDAEVYEAKLANVLSPEEMMEFKTWWAEVKFKVGHLNEQAKRLSVAIGLSSSGLGWTAP